MRLLRGMLATAIVTVAVAGSAYAQALGQIHGKVTDNTAAVMPGVTVTVAGTGLQQPLVAVTSQSGTYSFPVVPIGTYAVTFELSGFKKVTREGVMLTTGFDATVDMKMEIGKVEEAVTVISESPLVDTKKTTTGGDFTVDQMLKIPTARDPWQVINMAPSIVLSGVNVGGSSSGQQLTVSAFGQSGSVQWNLEGGNITDMSSNSSPAYFNFDSFQEIQVVTAGGDVSVQSAGVFINLITKSGSNVLKGAADTTFENASMQGQNVTQAQFNTDLGTSVNSTGLSGNPLHKIANYDGDVGGPIMKNKLWFWGSTDYQDINVGVSNFFNTSLAGCNPPPSTFAQLSAVQGCLNNDKTTIQDFNGKLNYQLNTTNKFQFLFQSDRKLRNNRGATSNTATAATQSQYSSGGAWKFQNPTYQLTHTWLPSDKLVFVNQMTYVQGGFFLDYHDNTTCGSSTYARDLAGQDPTDPTCEWNIQNLSNHTTGFSSRALGTSYQTVRPSWEVKTDDNYFLPHVLGGDHAIKFGVGWRKNPVLSFSHSSGGGGATYDCVGNSTANCGTIGADGANNQFVAPGSAVGLVPFQADLIRDSLTNYDWWTWDSYIQDSYTTKRLTISGGVRQDWQDSKFLGGCVQANVINPAILPGQCENAVGTGHSFNNFSPRVSATYDLTGHGTTAIHGSFNYYYQTKITLANALDNLATTVDLTWGPNQKSGACATAAGAPCWTDANHDGFIQANELIGVPTSNTGLFANGVLTNATPNLDPNLTLNRTREEVLGVDHQLAGNLHASVDYTHRYTDLGSASYIVGTQPGAAGFPAQNLWVQETFTDPQTGISAPYFVTCAGCVLPTGGLFTTNSLTYQTFNGASVTLTKRLSNRWQGNVSYQWNDFRGFTPTGSFGTSGSTPGNPTGIIFTNGFTNNTPDYVIKGFASVELPWYGLLAATNWNLNQGNVRSETISGPGTIANCPPGTPSAQCTASGSAGSTIKYNTFAFQNFGTTRLPTVNLIDVSVSKNLDFGRQKLTVTLNCFNVLNINTIQGFSSNTASNNGLNGASGSFLAINSIVPPRVFRIDLRYAF
jgi:hypothetical protein